MADAVHHLASGKVRELYTAGDDHLVLVASDRISAFDVVLPTPIPDKGRVLTGLSLFWFERTADIVPNHVVSARLDDLPAELRDPDLAGRAMLCRRLEMLPVEVRRARLPGGLGLEGLPRHRAAVRAAAAGGAGRGRPAAGADLHARRRRARSASTTRTSRPTTRAT